MPVTFDNIQIVAEYDRPYLADEWGYESFHDIAKGAVTPVDVCGVGRCFWTNLPTKLLLNTSREEQNLWASKACDFPNYRCLLEMLQGPFPGNEKRGAEGLQKLQERSITNRITTTYL